MTNSLNSSGKPRLSKPGWVMIIASLAGLADAAYLTANYYLGSEISCSVTKGCEQVLTSEYATVMGVPVSLIGLLYYAGVFLGVYYYSLTDDARFKQAYTGMVSAGLVVTAYLVYLQLFVIQAICQYCMISAIITVTLALAIAWERFVSRPRVGEGSSPSILPKDQAGQ